MPTFSLGTVLKLTRLAEVVAPGTTLGPSPNAVTNTCSLLHIKLLDVASILASSLCPFGAY